MTELELLGLCSPDMMPCFFLPLGLQEVCMSNIHTPPADLPDSRNKVEAAVATMQFGKLLIVVFLITNGAHILDFCAKKSV